MSKRTISVDHGSFLIHKMRIVWIPHCPIWGQEDDFIILPVHLFVYRKRLRFEVRKDPVKL